MSPHRRSKVGGRRPGPGRPSLGDAARSVRLQIFVTPAVDARLTAAAKAACVKPTTLAADMLERAVDAIEQRIARSVDPIADELAEPTT